ncbi:hypothetical protein [Thiobacter aerophilum]|uniref:Uncharacterized protein n=1 Tax=Thiobacter aerophilum TaxID=3121275 RepID=A0ABV0EH13_9BURK
MIRYGQQIRLHRKDEKRLAMITGSSPSGVRTVDGLNRFIEMHLPMFEQDTPEARLLKLLLLDEKITPAGRR